MSGFKIVKLVCENHGIFTGKELPIDGQNMVVEGKTGKGKTTLISLLSKIIKKSPNIKMGADKETLQAYLENDEGETLYLKRVNTPKESKPLFIDDNGEKIPVKDVEKMIFDISQDPLGLLRKTGQERYEFILKCSDIDIKKFNELKIERQVKAEERKESKKYATRLLEKRGDSPGIVERIDVSLAQGELQGAYSHNNEIDKAIEGRKGLVESLVEKVEKMKQLKLEIETLEGRIEAADEYLAENKKIDTTETEEELKNAAAINVKADTYDLWSSRNNEYLEENQKWCLLDEEVIALDQDIKELTDGINFPLEGVSVVDSDIFYNGINYDSLGTSEQILISAALVAKYIVSQKKSINIMTIDRAESMDIETQMKVIEACNKIGVQIFLSVVDRKSDEDTFSVEYSEFIK